MRRTVLLAVALSLLVVTGARAWTWPATGPVLRPFVFDPASPISAGQHRGILVGGSSGESVLAPAAGTVSFAGSVPGNGLALTIRTADGYAVTLVHLGSIAVTRGATVSESQAVGTVGTRAACPQSTSAFALRRRPRATSIRWLPAGRPVPPVEPLLTPSPAAEAPAAEPPTEAAPDGSPQVPYDGAPASAPDGETSTQPAEDAPVAEPMSDTGAATGPVSPAMRPRFRRSELRHGPCRCGVGRPCQPGGRGLGCCRYVRRGTGAVRAGRARPAPPAPTFGVDPTDAVATAEGAEAEAALHRPSQVRSLSRPQPTCPIRPPCPRPPTRARRL